VSSPDAFFEFWSKDRFLAQGVTNPVCDFCSKELVEFPVPVLKQPFDYAILVQKQDGNLDRQLSHVVKGGMALCPICFKKVREELKETTTQ
jgi:hypothetical protein